MTNPNKIRLRIYNVAQGGVAFALNEETSEPVFLSRQLCAGMEVDESDVGRYIMALVGDGAKGKQAMTFDWVEELDDDVIDEFEKRLAKLERAVASLQLGVAPT